MRLLRFVEQDGPETLDEMFIEGTIEFNSNIVAILDQRKRADVSTRVLKSLWIWPPAVNTVKPRDMTKCQGA